MYYYNDYKHFWVALQILGRMLLNLDQTRLSQDFQSGPTVLTCSDFDVPADDGAQPVPGSAVVAGQVDVVSQVIGTAKNIQLLGFLFC